MRRIAPFVFSVVSLVLFASATTSTATPLAVAPAVPTVGPVPPYPTQTIGQVHELQTGPDERPTAPTPTPEPTSTPSSGPVPESVIPPDERVRVSPTTAYPWRTIAYLELYNASLTPTGLCTGTFIGPRVVLTAAHCIYQRASFGGWVGAAAVVPGKDGVLEPYGYDWADNAWVPDEWIAAQLAGQPAPEWDWGFYRLPDTTLGNTVGWMTIGVLSDASLLTSDFNPVISGYPGDKPTGEQWMGTKSELYAVTTEELIYEIDTYGGQSGSGVWRGADGMIAGVHAYGLVSFNSGRRITQSFLDNMLSACGQLGCAFAYYIEPTATPTPSPTPTQTPVESATPTLTATATQVPSTATHRVYLPAIQR